MNNRTTVCHKLQTIFKSRGFRIKIYFVMPINCQLIIFFIENHCFYRPLHNAVFSQNVVHYPTPPYTASYCPNLTHAALLCPNLPHTVPACLTSPQPVPYRPSLPNTVPACPAPSQPAQYRPSLPHTVPACLTPSQPVPHRPSLSHTVPTCPTLVMVVRSQARWQQPPSN